MIKPTRVDACLNQLSRYQSGITLLELLLTIAVLSVLATLMYKGGAAAIQDKKVEIVMKNGQWLANRIQATRLEVLNPKELPSDQVFRYPMSNAVLDWAAISRIGEIRIPPETVFDSGEFSSQYQMQHRPAMVVLGLSLPVVDIVAYGVESELITEPAESSAQEVQDELPIVGSQMTFFPRAESVLVTTQRASSVLVKRALYWQESR